jgi:hypothetical protein
MCVQCATGWFSGTGASLCIACSAGKYLTNASGATDASSCTSVSIDALLVSNVPYHGCQYVMVCVRSAQLGGSQEQGHLCALFAVLAST